MQVPERCDFCSGEAFDGKYCIESRLGEGTFGAVYKVKDRQGSIYAVKLLKLWAVSPEDCDKLRERFTMEFETGRIKSEYLVHSYSCGEIKGNPYILMEFCPNGDLRNYSEHHSVDYIRAGRQILYGLSALHLCGKVHRDLKPENVLLRADNTAVLTDFGISGDQNKRMTERGFMGRPQQIFGTYPYMPPEQVNPPRGGQATVLPTTDIFSFGVMMYELMVGKLPFGELNANTLARYLYNGKNGIWDRTALDTIQNSEIWKTIIEGCLKPDFKQRIQTADSIIKMLPESKEDKGCPLEGDSSILHAPNGCLLRVMQGEEYGKTYRLDDLLGNRSLITMGRNDTDTVNMIPITEAQSRYISRHHCTLEKDRVTGYWYIRDGQWTAGGWKESLNGTYVNSTEVDRYGIRFNPGDIISIGDVKLRVEGY